jgi:iron-sulfur cluster repair protein YtfE (RIC family)
VPTANVSGSNSWAEDVMDFVAREHATVREHLDHMVAIAEATPTGVPVAVRERLDAVFSFLHTDLLALMALEETTLYPALGQIPDVPHTPEAMALDHASVRRIIGELDDRAGADGWERWESDLHQLLRELETLIRLHVDKEEYLYGPLLSRLGSPDLATLRERLATHSALHRRAAG